MTIWPNLVEIHEWYIPTNFEVNLANGLWEEVADAKMSSNVLWGCRDGPEVTVLGFTFG